MSVEGYVEYIYLTHLLGNEFDKLAGKQWMPAERMEDCFRDAMKVAFRNKGFKIGGRYDAIAEKTLNRMYQNEVIVEEGDDLTGRFVSFQIPPKDDFLKSIISSSEVGRRVGRLGDDALARAISTLADREQWEVTEPDNGLETSGGVYVASDVAIPASDRIVKLTHNQIEDSDKAISELIDVLDKDNGEPSEPGLRERILGQIKAGRELIRAGEYRAYLLYELLVRALNELINRYQNPTIVALANALLGAVVSQIIQAS